MKTVRSRLIVAAVAVALSGLTACAGLQPGTLPRRVIDAVTTTTLEILGQIPLEGDCHAD